MKYFTSITNRYSCIQFLVKFDRKSCCVLLSGILILSAEHQESVIELVARRMHTAIPDAAHLALPFAAAICLPYMELLPPVGSSTEASVSYGSLDGACGAAVRPS
jgi:hypothetical protein